MTSHSATLLLAGATSLSGADLNHDILRFALDVEVCDVLEGWQHRSGWPQHVATEATAEPRRAGNRVQV